MDSLGGHFVDDWDKISISPIQRAGSAFTKRGADIGRTAGGSMGGQEAMMQQKRTTFVSEFYKSCYILAVATYAPSDGRWNAKAYIYWKRKSEKHIGTLAHSEHFDSSWAAENHALGMAHQWCDEHVVDLIPSPVNARPSR